MQPRETVQLVTPPAWQRGAALITDTLIVVLITMVFFGSQRDEIDPVLSREEVLPLLVVMAVYHIIFLCTTSTTPGKALFGMSIVDKDGPALRPDQAILRYLVFFLGGPVFAVGHFVSIYFVLRDKEMRRSVYDRIVGTRVIKGRPHQVDTMNRYRDF